MKKLNALALAIGVGLTLPAAASPVVMDFEGINDLAAVGNFYAASGVSFSANAIGVIDSDAGGTGNFSFEPSASTAMAFMTGTEVFLNYGAGFNSVSFFYSSSRPGSVSFWTGVNGTGQMLDEMSLAAQYDTGGNCTAGGDPNGEFCNWTLVNGSLASTALSVKFIGTAQQVFFDNITLSSTAPGNGGNVPEPGTLALVGAALLGLGAARRRKSA